MNKNLVALIAVITIIAGCGGGKSEVPSPPQQTRLLAQVTQVNDATTIHSYRANYTITKNADGSVTLTNLIDQTSQSFPSSLKTIKFADKFVSFDSTGIPGQSYRLYQAAFNRQPDLGGLGFWTHILQGGMSLDAVAGYFYSSPEFQTMYGKVSDDQFITLLYNNVLHRVPDQGGHDFWSLQVKNGLSRQNVIVYFSESPENVSNVASAIKNGIDYIPDAADMKVIPVKNSSYENKTAALAAIGPQPIPQTGNLPGWNTVTYAFGDFFQDGSYAMVSHTQESDNSVNYPAGPPTGHIKFWKKDSIGAWIDRTSDILKDNNGCILSRKAVVADFNNDGIPDVYFACSGFDKEPFDGEYQRVLLSDSASHVYKNTQILVKGYTHGASAADIDHDGKVDIVVADMRGNGNKSPIYVLKGDGKGGFQPDYSQFDRPEINWQANGPFFNIELIDFEGRGQFDVIAGGIETAAHKTLIIPYDEKKSNYVESTLKRLPTDSFYTTPEDFVYDAPTRTIYVNRINDWGPNWPNGVANSMQKVNYDSMQGVTIFTHQGFYNQKETLVWIEWIGLYKGRLVSLNSGYGFEISK